jgi:hypothetical protein
MIPQTHYAKAGSLSIAYQVVGDGPLDLVVVPGWISNIEVFWEDAHVARFFERLSTFTRLILFEKRGTGLSDRSTEAATLEERMDDVRAVLDAVASSRAALLAAPPGKRRVCQHHRARRGREDRPVLPLPCVPAHVCSRRRSWRRSWTGGSRRE